MDERNETRFGRRALERVLRRASQLSAARPVEGLTTSEIQRVAEEAGIPDWAVVRAIREEQSGLLASTSDGNRIVRSASTSRRRDLVEADLTSQLIRRSMARVAAPVAGREQIWATLGWWPDERALASPGYLSARTVARSGRTDVILEADVAGLRRRHVLGAGLLAAFVLGVVVGSLPVLLIPLAMVLGFGGAVVMGAATYESRIRAIGARLDRLLGEVTRESVTSLPLASVQEVDHGSDQFELLRRGNDS